MIGLASSSSLAEKMSDISLDASLSTLRFVDNMLTLRFFVDVKRMSAVCRLDNVEPLLTLRFVDEMLTLWFFVDVKRMSVVCSFDNVEPPSTLRLVDEKVSKFSVLTAENDI